MARSGRWLAVISAIAAVAAGCSSGAEPLAADTLAIGPGVSPEELARARTITRLVKSRCTSCHTAGKAEVRRWGAMMTAVRRECLAPPDLTAAQRVACLRSDPADPSSAFSESRLGFYAAATKHSSFKTLFTEAGTGSAGHAQFVEQASMPPATFTGTRYSEQELAALESWVLDGFPAIDEAMIEPTRACVPFRSPKLAEHLERMNAIGWAARLRDAALPMYGCPGVASGEQCLATLVDKTALWGRAGIPQTVRLLHELPFSTYAWMRSSADGRFAGFGGQPARILDLAAPGGPRPIRVAAEFDAAFLPDNSGFSYANTSGSRVHVCRQSVLLDAAAQAEPSIALTEPGCAPITSADYEAIGASLDGSMLLMASGTHENDITFSLTHGPLSGSFDDRAFTKIVPMLSSGISWVGRPPITLAHPYEGDGGLSPSNELLYTRFGNRAGRRGYRIRRLTPHGVVSPAPGQPAFGIDAEELATVCLSGGKVMGSLDERFLVTHQYVDPEENPELTNNSSNVILIDLLTNETIRLTQMARGQYAFSPTFRADGWIYFLVRDANTRKETLVASDAAIRRTR